MPSDKPEQVRMWSFRNAPREFQTLFPDGKDSDWVAHLPQSERRAVEPSMLRWRPIYPVTSAELADRSVVYRGAPSDALESIPEFGTTVTGPPPSGEERRNGIRVRIARPSRYKTPTQTGFGHTIDISRTGIAFTTETSLTRNTDVTLRVSWPVPLEGGEPVEFCAVGRLARAEPMKAAMRMDSVSFSVED